MSAPLILVVEDNEPLRRMLALTLSTAGYRVATAGDGRQALDHAAQELPAVVTTDLMLPDLDGSELLAQLRALDGADRLPVIAMSGSEEKLVALGGITPAFNHSLLKPVPPWQLLATVGRYATVQLPDATIGAGRGVLLVDDNAVQCKLTRLQLERLGFIVTTAADGAEALRAARSWRPDVIVSDVLMPAVDGFELCQAIRADEQLGRVPVILMSSAYVEDEDRRLGARAGATAYLERGPELGELERALASCLGNQTAPPPEPFPAFEVEHARRVRHQLEQHVAAEAALSHQLELKTVQLSVVAGISNLITRALDTADVVGETLLRCMEVAGIAAGVAWMHGPDGALQWTADAGAAEYAAAARRAVEQREVEHELFPDGGLVTLEPDDAGHEVAVASLATRGEPLGMIAIAWHELDSDRERLGFVRTIAGQLSEAIATRSAIEQLDGSREETIRRLALAAEFRDEDTARHTERVSRYSRLLAERLGLGDERAELIRIASVMHDVGKIGVSDTILLKPGPLTAEEFEQIKLHTSFGHRILGGSHVDLLDLAAKIALTHHERVDGTGYPRKLRGEEIPIEGRIVAVADVFDALTSPRVYRPAMSIESAIETMRAGRGTQFDAQVLDTFLDALDEILSIRAIWLDAAVAA